MSKTRASLVFVEFSPRLIASVLPYTVPPFDVQIHVHHALQHSSTRTANHGPFQISQRPMSNRNIACHVFVDVVVGLAYKAEFLVNPPHVFMEHNAW